MKALFFGSVGSVIETSELQHDAFNKAFVQHGLNWHWDLDEYRSMLKTSGGAKRVAAYARARNETVDAVAVHATKSLIFVDDLASRDVQPLPDVIAILKAAGDAGLKTGFISTTDKTTIDIIVAKVAAQGLQPFDIITHRGLGMAEKPAPDAYLFALKQAGVTAKNSLAIEDNIDGVAAAQTAGVRAFGLPGAYSEPGDLDGADAVFKTGIVAALQTWIMSD
jgi:HAD superfamily hydrolase (TIGR01509 family)